MSVVEDAKSKVVGDVTAATREGLDEFQAVVEAQSADDIAQLTRQHDDDTTALAAASTQHNVDVATIQDLTGQVSTLRSANSTLQQKYDDYVRTHPDVDPPPPPPGKFLNIGSSKGSVGQDFVDKQFGGSGAPIVRFFDNGSIPTSWTDTPYLPDDNRPVIASVVASPADIAAGKLDAQFRAWLKDAPKGRMVSVCHEGDAKTRDNPPKYSREQWVAAQERFLPIAAEMGMTPVAILTYMSLENGTARSFWSDKMLAVPRIHIGFDSYQPGVPSATPAKMAGKIAPFCDGLGKPWVMPEIGIGLANAPGTTDVQKDQARAAKLVDLFTYLATQVYADPNKGCKAVCYWPNGGFVPGVASWAAITADYPVG